jgi:SAM-dependent methyltransferase
MGFLGKAVDILRYVYRAIVPARIRSSALIAHVKLRLLGHDAIYPDDYYQDIDAVSHHSAAFIARSIMDSFRPHSVVDVGCGSGWLLVALRQAGCRVHGFDNSRAAVSRCIALGLAVERMDLEKPIWGADRFDVAVSLEVAEHLPQKAAQAYVRFLTTLSDVVVLTAAQPGQGGVSHLNERPRHYWVEKFAGLGFVEDGKTSARWVAEWRAAAVAEWYVDNLMVFCRKQPEGSP